MDDDKLIEKLEEGVREAQELLRRRKEALAALTGKSGNGKKGPRGLRAGSIPALVQATLKSTKQSLSADDLVSHLKKNLPEVDARKISLALSRYVREGLYFVLAEDGKYSLK